VFLCNRERDVEAAQRTRVQCAVSSWERLRGVISGAGE